MKTDGLKTKLPRLFLVSIIIPGLILLVLGYFTINNYIDGRARQTALSNLKVAGLVFKGRQKEIARAFELSAGRTDSWALKKLLGLDYIEYTRKKTGHPSEIAAKAFEGLSIGGLRLMNKKELLKYGRHLADLIDINIPSPSQAQTADRHELDYVLVMEYAMPLLNNQGQTYMVLYGGKVINCDFALTDEIHEAIFKNKRSDKKINGTIAILQNNVRIATNVIDNEGQRAVGLKVPEDIARRISDRTFAAGEQELIAGESLRDINGRPLGLLCVGTPERSFAALRRNLLLGLGTVILLTGLTASRLFLFLVKKLADPADTPSP